MTFAMIVAHGATGTWLDEIIELGIPLVVLVALYVWSNRHPQRKPSATEEPRGPVEKPK